MESTDVKVIKKHFNNIHKRFKPYLKTEYYNCWSLTSFLNGWEKNVYWMDEDEIEEHLKNHTQRIRVPKVGDIVEFRTRNANEYTHRNGIMHTAIITQIITKGKKRKIICVHKPGSGRLEVKDLYEIEFMYGPSANKTLFSRPIAA